jgi:hypothetical protein
MTATTEVRCSFCNGTVLCVDEGGCCEQCILDAEGNASGVMGELERFVEFGLDAGFLSQASARLAAPAPASGFTSEEMRQAFEMSLANATGPLTGTLLRREAVATGERGIWSGRPSQLLDLNDEDSAWSLPNMIRQTRLWRGMSLESYAEMFGVSPLDLAIWEQGTPPQEIARRMASHFSFALDFFLKCARGPDRDCLECNRCGVPAPRRNPQRFEEGWDVAGGTELVCPDCLRPADLEW